MEYHTFNGYNFYSGKCESTVLETGGCYAYGDFKVYPGKVTEDLKKSLYILPTYFVGSDYSGGSSSVSNHRVFLKRFKDVEGVYNVSGDMGTYSIAIRADVYNDNEDIKDVLKGLEGYSVIDEEDMREVESEWEVKAMPDLIHDVCSEIDLETYLPDYEKYLEDTESIEQIIWEGISECNLDLDWSYEYKSAYINHELILPYVEDIILIKHCLDLPLLINREWSCETNHELFLEKLINV